MPPGKDKESGLSPEISRLSAMLARDPNSKLFIPLAEEYIRAGMPDEAVMTLEEGLKANPFYMSARVMLGKAYLEKGDTDKAREQFETVVKSVPDNLLAHKRLAEIYRTQGRTADAARSLRMITLLNPRDDEARRLLAQLESGPAPEQPVELAAQGPAAEFYAGERTAEPATSDTEAPPAQFGMPVFDLTEVGEAESEEETEAGHAATAGLDVIEMPVPENMITLEETRRQKPADDVPADITEAVLEPEAVLEAVPEEAGEIVPDDILDIPEVIHEAVIPEEVIPNTVAEEVPITDMVESEEAVSPAEAPGETAGGYGLQKEALEDIFAAYQDTQPGEDSKPEGAADAGVYEIEEDISGFEIEGLKVEPIKIEPAVEEPVKKEPFETETLAELYISQGFFDRAINIYKNMLVTSPDDEEVKRKLEETYRLASLDSVKAAEAARKEAEDTAATYEPVDFDALEEAEVYEADAFEEPGEQLSGAGRAGYDEGAVRLLEQFLENIRRKARS